MANKKKLFVIMFLENACMLLKYAGVSLFLG